MIDWDTVEEYTEDAKGIAFDTCHKIYVLMDDQQLALMREYEYDEIITSEEQTPSQMLDTLREWFEKSCPLRFIEAVETNTEDPNKGFTVLVEQGATEHEECEDCADPTCQGACFDYEDEDEEEEDEDEED